MEENDSTVWGKTDGSENQYRCALSLYFMTEVSSTLKISTYRAIGAPVHEKNVVDGLNTRYKKVLRKKWTVYQKPYHNM